MASSSNSIESLIGTWDHVRSENLDAFLKEMGVPMPIRMLAKRMNPRLVISKNDNIWTLKTDMPLKTKITTFTPDVQFQDTTPDGKEVQTIIRFENGKWMQTVWDKNGKESHVTRFVDEEGFHRIEMKSGDIVAHRWFKRAE